MFLGLKKCSAIVTGAISSVQVLSQSSEHLHLPSVSKVQARVCGHFCQGPFVTRWGYPHLTHCQLRSGPPTGGPAIYLSLLLTDRTVLIDILCLRRSQSIVSPFSPSLRCCRACMPTHCMDSGSPVKGAPGHICLVIPVTFQTWKGVLMGTNQFYFHASLKFQ